MAVLESLLRQDGLKVAESRVNRRCCATDCGTASEPKNGKYTQDDILMPHHLQVRALTREVGSLKEDLRREIKRREKAIITAREAEEVKLECEKRVKQLEYSKRCQSCSTGQRTVTRILQVKSSGFFQKAGARKFYGTAAGTA